MKRVAAATVLAALALDATGAAVDRPLVARTLAARGDRFIEVPAAKGAPRFVNMAEGRTIAYRDGAIEWGSRDSAGRLRYEFAGARAAAPEGVGESGVTYNFFLGERANWATGLRSYSQVAYREPWRGIDAIYSGDRGGIKYHFEVTAGADPRRIAFMVRGAGDARVLEDGAVEWAVGGARVRDEPPVAFQPGAGGDALVPVRFTLEPAGADAWRLGFEVGDYDRSKALVVDPAWTAFAGLVGGNAADQVYGVARDAAGNTLACGITASTDLPVPGAQDPSWNGGYDAFIVKFNPAGAPQFVTYFGGGLFDACTAIALHSDGSIFVAGGTTSTNFPFAGAGDANFRRAKADADRDAFVARFNAAGNAILYSGVVGGSGEDQAQALGLDSVGRAYLAGYTRSAAWPAVAGPAGAFAGGMDAFVARVNAAGTGLEYSGYVGGNGAAEAAHAIAVAPDFSVAIAGETDSTAGLPSMAGTFRTLPGTGTSDGFVARISPAGAMQRFTVLTGTTSGTQTGADRALGIAFHNDGSLLVVGESDSGGFPANDAGVQAGAHAAALQAVPAGAMDGFVAHMAANLSAVYSRGYLGASGYDAVEAVATNGAGATFFVGTVSSTAGFPTSATPGLAVGGLGGQDGFIGRLPLAPSGYIGFVGSAGNDAMHAIATSPDATLSAGGATTSGAGFPAATTGALSAGAALTNGVVLRINPAGAPAAIALVSGSPQAANVGTAFAAPLRVQVNDAQGFGVPQASVTFTPPASGATASLAPGTVVTTDAGGFAQVGATAGAIAGAYSVIASAAGVVPAVSFQLTNVAPITLAPPLLDFGGQSMGTTSPQRAVTVTNNGPGSVTVTGVTVSNPQFARTHDCGVLAEGANCTILVTFTPAPAAGPLNSTVDVVASLDVASTTPGSPHAAALAGTGEKSLVTHFYRAILGRAPDPAGKAFWEFESERMQALGPNLAGTWNAMAPVFYASAEYAAFGRSDAAFVADLYRTFFNRAPDGPGLAYWQGQLAGGLPRKSALLAFIFSPEFASLVQGAFGAAPTRAEIDVVMDFFRGFLLRLPASGGFAHWVGQLRSAQCAGPSATGQVYGVVETLSSAIVNGAEYAGRSRTDAQFVIDLYDAFLRRGADPAAINYWVSELATKSRDQVRMAFIASAEFGGRVNAVVAQGCPP